MSYKILPQKDFQSTVAKKILNKFFVRKEGYTTHLTMARPMGKWGIKSRKDLKKFFKNYSRLIIQSNLFFSILEVQSYYAPILVDIDFSKKTDNIEPLYTENTILDVHRAYISVLKYIQGIEPNNLECIVLTKDPYIKQENNGTLTLKHGFHLHFPKIWVNTNIRKLILSLSQKSTTVELDDVTTKGWLLYGSKKNRNSGTYKVEFCLDKDGGKFSIDKYLTGHICSDIITEKPFTAKIENLTQVLSILPAISNPKYHFEAINSTPEIQNKLFEQEITQRKKESASDVVVIYTKQDREDLQVMVSCLSKTFSEEFKSWMLVLQVIYNVFGCNDDEDELESGLEIAQTFSSKCPEKYNEEEVTKMYHKMHINSYGLGIVGNMLRKSKPPRIRRRKKN